MGRLDNKVAIVTGAASGIGAATAKLFADEGAQVILTDIQADKGAEAAANIGKGARFLEHDVTNEDNWASIVEDVTSQHGKLDILVNNAGTLLFSGLTDQTTEQIRRVLDINLLGTILGTQAAARAMLPNKFGSIVNISSVDGLTAANALSAYVASKWGVRGFTKAAALELGHKGIRVNSIHPGGVDTPLANRFGQAREDFDKGFKVFTAQRACDPLEIAYGVLYFASEEGAYCMGSELAIDGGMVAGHYYNGLPGSPGFGEG